MAGYHGRVSFQMIETRGSRALAGGFPVPKYIEFCAWALLEGLDVWLDESNTTVSKYVKVRECGNEFKVRFSNHKPNKFQQKVEDSDFYVGVSNGHVATTEDAKKAVLEWRAKGHGKERRPRFRSGH